MEDGHSLGWRAAKSNYYVHVNGHLRHRYVTTTRNAEYIIDEIKSRYDGLTLKSLSIRRSTDGEPPVLIYTSMDERNWKQTSKTFL